MVTHYSANGNDSACGRNSPTLVSSRVIEDVSCKSCQRTLVKASAPVTSMRKSPSLAQLRKTAAAPAARPLAEPAAPAARVAGFSVKADWSARLAGQAERCRLPRGARKQAHV
ncbi:hypothetical protein G7009_23265 [Pseudomonas capeferrum]|uniref:hypothetical protein n=1 Tax=Pseudomonas capeferrum TaxID=1495066 RepID=UPI0015E3CAD6|nr:hypothetical protein [Pseudomonas capeferrum]MBA1204637.1 hypothetical protein [Pseudomonas capeferrum]